MKLLIAEDEAYSKASLVKYVREYAHFGNAEILEAENGKEAWDLFEKYSPEIVISDIRMPLMDGLELTSLIADSGIKTKVIIISGYAEFQYAQKAILYGAKGYLLKPIQVKELYSLFDDILQKNSASGEEGAAAKMPELQMNSNLVLSELLTNRRDFSENDYNEYTLELLKWYSVILIRFGKADHQTVKTADINIRQYLNTSLGIVARCVMINKHQIAVLVKETEKTTRQRVINNIVKLLDGLGADYCCGVSEPAEGPKKAFETFLHAEYAQQGRLLRGGRVFFYEKENTQYTYVNKLDGNSQLNLKKYVSRGACPKAIYLVRRFFEDIRKEQAPSIQSLYDVVKGIELVLSGCLSDLGQGIRVPHFELERYDSLGALQAEVEAWVERVCALCGAAETASGEAPESVVELIVSYIEKNYGENLTLKYLAENVFFMNSSYLSFLLREKTGKTFSCFLMETRMRHALELVKNSTFSITDIAGLCGYNDTSQFIQVFKKKYGSTPYRVRRFPEESKNVKCETE